MYAKTHKSNNNFPIYIQTKLFKEEQPELYAIISGHLGIAEVSYITSSTLLYQDLWNYYNNPEIKQNIEDLFAGTTGGVSGLISGYIQ